MLSIGADSAEHMMEQANMTARVYARAAFEFVEDQEHLFKGWTPEAKATFVAGFMNAAAIDLLGVDCLSAGQHVAESLNNGLGNGMGGGLIGAVSEVAEAIKEASVTIANAGLE